jgi:hypothetical protein
VGIFVLYGAVPFLSTRAHGVPFLHTSGAHLTAALQGAIAMGAMLPPMPPSIRPLDTNSLQKNSGTTFGGLGFSFYICPKQI